MGSLVSEKQIRYFWNNYSKWALKNYKNYLQDRYWRLFPCPLHAPICISNGMFPSKSAPKVLLEASKNFILIVELYKLHKNWRKSTKSSLHKPCIFGIMIPSWLSKIVLGFCYTVCHILWGFHGNFYEKWTQLIRETKKIKVQIFQEFLFLIKVNICR